MLDGLKGKQIKDAGKSRFNTKKPEDNTGKKETKPKGGGFFSFFKKKSSVVEKGQHMHDIANRRNGGRDNAAKPLQEIVSEMLEFIRDDKLAETTHLFNELKFSEVPTTLDQLEAYAEKANDLYAFVDYKLTDESEDGVEYRNNLNKWRGELTTAIYTLRDHLIQNDEESILRYGLVNQYRNLHPDSPVPSLITEQQKQLGVIVFGGTVPNDCGKFASRLLGELEVAPMAKLWNEIQRGQLDDNQIRIALQDLIDSGPSKDTLFYISDAKFGYGHHAKTSFGASGGKIYSLEAHVGKPFLLAPELREYDSQHSYLEMDDAYIDHRSQAGPTANYGKMDIANMDMSEVLELIKKASLRKPDVYLGRH
ncbi:hypothetical protein [Spirosoma humi]